MTAISYPKHTELHTSPYFNGYPVQDKYQPLMVSYLQVHEQVLMRALTECPRVCVLRFELKIPINTIMHSDLLITKFIDSLRYRVKSDLAKKNNRTGRSTKCQLRYIWVKELSKSHGWHYHLVIFLNHDVYNCFGSLNASSGNMFARIRASWASALGVNYEGVSGLIHIPNNAVYKVDVNAINGVEQIHDVLYRLSYFAKVQTKPFGSSSSNRFFGYSIL